MSLEIVVGPMFSGKSTYALSYIRRQLAIKKNVVVIKPNIDNRYSTESLLVTHDKETTPCIMWDVMDNLHPTQSMYDADVIVFEEAQFFKGLETFIIYILQSMHKSILVVGLDGDAKQNQFGEILRLIPYANKVTKLCALCSKCGDGTEAPFTIKHSQLVQQVDVGGIDKYEAVCLKHLREHLINV
jgi:thymidine kinase